MGTMIFAFIIASIAAFLTRWLLSKAPGGGGFWWLFKTAAPVIVFGKVFVGAALFGTLAAREPGPIYVAPNGVSYYATSNTANDGKYDASCNCIKHASD